MKSNRTIFLEDREAESYAKNKMEESSFEDIKNVLWKIKLADAILKEAKFNGVIIKIGDEIEHQLGTVWVGKTAIVAN